MACERPSILDTRGTLLRRAPDPAPVEDDATLTNTAAAALPAAPGWDCAAEVGKADLPAVPAVQGAVALAALIFSKSDTRFIVGGGHGGRASGWRRCCRQERGLIGRTPRKAHDGWPCRALRNSGTASFQEPFQTNGVPFESARGLTATYWTRSRGHKGHTPSHAVGSKKHPMPQP